MILQGSNHRKVRLVVIKFRKYASFWWKNLNEQREIEGISKIITWDKMKKELKRKYLPARFFFSKLKSLRKKNQGVMELLLRDGTMVTS